MSKEHGAGKGDRYRRANLQKWEEGWKHLRKAQEREDKLKANTLNDNKPSN